MIQNAPRKKPAEKIMKLYEQKGERDGITKGLAAISPLAAIELRLRIPCITSQFQNRLGTSGVTHHCQTWVQMAASLVE